MQVPELQNTASETLFIPPRNFPQNMQITQHLHIASSFLEVHVLQAAGFLARSDLSSDWLNKLAWVWLVLLPLSNYHRRLCQQCSNSASRNMVRFRHTIFFFIIISIPFLALVRSCDHCSFCIWTQVGLVPGLGLIRIKHATRHCNSAVGS